MERSLYYLRLFPGTEERYDQIHRDVPGAVARGMTDAGLSHVSGFRRGTDVWWYAQAEPDRTTAFSRVGKGVINRRWGHEFRDVIAEIEAPGGGQIWYDEIFHTEAAAPEGSSEAMAAAGCRDYSAFRRGAHVINVGHFYPDVDTVIARINTTEVAARWASELDGVITTFSDAEGRNVTAREIYHQP